MLEHERRVPSPYFPSAGESTIRAEYHQTLLGDTFLRISKLGPRKYRAQDGS